MNPTTGPEPLGQEIVCPELNNLGYRIFTLYIAEAAMTRFTLYRWAQSESEPEIPVVYTETYLESDDAYFVYFLGQITGSLLGEPEFEELLTAIWNLVRRRERERIITERFGRQIPCPEFEALGFRVFVQSRLAWQQWSMYLWPAESAKPYPYTPYFQREQDPMSVNQGLVAFIRELHSVLARTPGEQGLKLAAEAIIKRLTGKEVSDAS